MSNEAEGHTEAPVCGADGLKHLLQRIAEQIADSDRRQGEALIEMKDRLGTLGDEARSVRSRVPSEFAPAFERIEEGMALLAERIAGVAPARRGQPWAASQPAAQAAERHAKAEVPVAAAEAAPVQAPASAPLALRSAAGADAPSRAERIAAIDPFDFIEHATRSATGEWEASDADALTRIYESGEAGITARPTQAFAHAATTANAPVAETGIERQWVEDRLSDVAQRLERSIKEARADGAIAALGQRFDQFERRFDDAMHSVATRSDIEGLKLIEANIVELAGHVEQAARQLERLDAIEGQLVAVSDKLSDERLVGLMQQASPDLERLASVAVEQATARFAELRPAHAGSDIERLADLAAERAAVQVAGWSGARGAGDDHRLDDIRGLIEGFISERRHGDEQTSSMLDTMQQAMIRVLDRIDAIEVAQSRAVHAVAAPQAQHQPQSQPQPPHQSPAPRYAVDTELRADPPRASVPLDPALVPRVDRTAPPADPVPAARREPAPVESEQRLAQPRSKEDFIAAARRAARQAANEAPAAAPAAPAAAGSRAKAEPAAEGEKKRSLFSLGRKSVVASSIIVIIAMAGALTLARLQGTETTAASIAGAAQVGTAATVAASAVTEPPRVINAAGSAASDEQSAQLAADADASVSATADTAEVSGGEAADAHEPAEDVPAPAPAARRAAVTSGTLAGVTLQTSSKPSLRELNRLREQQDLATLSSRLGAEASKATPASLMVEQSFGSQPVAQPVAQPAAPVQPVDIAPDLYAAPSEPAPQKATALPPASVGPSSLRVAAAKGDPSAEFEVGARLAEGKGTDQSFAEAIQWYQRSAQKGFAQAQYRLATFYERGLGTKTDLARAAVWYKRAAEQGNVKAMHNLAVLSASRKAGAPDYDTAAKWFADAADRGLADSQFNLAVLYESGLGVPKDLRQAYKWLTVAARAGDGETVKRRERMRNELSRADLEAAEAMIRDWQPQAADPLANDPRVAGEAWKSRAGMAGPSG